MNPFFVVDVGNTSTKWAFADGRRVRKVYEIPTTQFVALRSREVSRLNLLNRPGGAIISCVVPNALPKVLAYLRTLGVPKPLLVSSKMNLGIGIRYPRPSNIGADRLVNAVAAVALYGAPAIVVDFGTAVTFDVISAKSGYIGGVIAPGLNLMTDYLHEKTALLPKIFLKEPVSCVGKNTEEAIRVGAVIGFRGLVREVLFMLAREMKGSLGGKSGIKVIATGGQSRLITSKIAEIDHVDPQLTLKGLNLLYTRLTKNKFVRVSGQKRVS